MDQNTLVDGGADGLVAIAEAFRQTGFPVTTIYLVSRMDEDDCLDWSIKAVLSPFTPDMEVDLVDAFVRLRREKKIPFVDRSVRVTGVPPDDAEASRIVKHARLLGGPPILIRDAMVDGLYIERALVAEFEPSTAAAA